MPTLMQQLPSTAVPEDLLKLVHLYAERNGLTISGAIRELLKQSPGLVRLADEININLDDLRVGDWGGHRERPDLDE